MSYNNDLKTEVEGTSTSGAAPETWHGKALGLARLHGRTAVIFLLNFSLAKGVAYLAPLLVASMVDTTMYGTIETALAGALFVANLISGGVFAALPKQMLLADNEPVEDILSASLAWSAAAGLIVGLICWSLGSGAIITLTGMFVAGGAIQQGFASYLRTTSHRNSAAWADNATIHAMFAAVLVMLIIRQHSLSALDGVSAVIAFMTFIAAAGVCWRTLKEDFKRRMAEALRIGMPLVLSSLFSAWIVASGRILTGSFGSAEATAHYAIGFRIAGLVAVLHQFVGTGMFARLFTLSSERFDRLVGWYVAGMGLVAFGISVAVRYAPFPSHIGHITSQDIVDARALFPAVMLQVLFILVAAALELRITRANIALRLLVPYVVVTGATALILCGLAALKMVSTAVVVGAVLAQTIAGVAVQFAVLWRHGERLSTLLRNTTAVGAVYLALSGVLFW